MYSNRFLTSRHSLWLWQQSPKAGVRGTVYPFEKVRATGDIEQQIRAFAFGQPQHFICPVRSRSVVDARDRSRIE